MIVDLKNQINKTYLIHRLKTFMQSEGVIPQSATLFEYRQNIMCAYALQVLNLVEKASEEETEISVFVDNILTKIRDYSLKDLNNVNILMKESAELEMLSLVLRWSMDDTNE